ncbi:GNAT family N-acetyltransferase [Agromyces sp. NPDC058110]|uniref:GNAT family N-acetyltransferase n=1 Tax=Agromyces sp. NPDC058110 TaxID=3346345 RepID=UPI0036DAD565
MLPALELPAPLGAPAAPDGVLRQAVAVDVDAVIALLTDDAVAVSRGHGADAFARDDYLRGFEAVAADPSNAIVVAELPGHGVVGTMQLTLIPGMSRGGASRLLVEAVRVRADLRSGGIGAAMMRWVTDAAAPTLGAALVQLTSDAVRTDAHRFYERLGFEGSHLGFKYRVPR